MGFAIVGYFDEKSDARIKSLWQGMADLKVCDYLINSENNPHFKFAMYDSIDEKHAKEVIMSLAGQTEEMNVCFKTYSFYPNAEPFICLDIAVSIPILKLQLEIKNSFYDDLENENCDFFTQGIWKPDCQLTLAFNKAMLSDAINYLADTELPFNGVLERIGLIKYHPAKQLFTYPLCREAKNLSKSY